MKRAYRQLGLALLFVAGSLGVIVIAADGTGNNMDLPEEVSTLDNAALSPSGRYLLQVIAVDGEPALTFEVTDTDGNTLYRSEDVFYKRHTTVFLWDEQDRVWVYSGDVGTYYWEQVSHLHNGRDWEKYTYAYEETPAPDYLKVFRPKYHQL